MGHSRTHLSCKIDSRAHTDTPDLPARRNSRDETGARDPIWLLNLASFDFSSRPRGQIVMATRSNSQVLSKPQFATSEPTSWPFQRRTRLSFFGNLGQRSLQ